MNLQNESWLVFAYCIDNCTSPCYLYSGTWKQNRQTSNRNYGKKPNCGNSKFWVFVILNKHSSQLGRFSRPFMVFWSTVLDSPAWEREGHTGESPSKDQKGTGTFLLWGKVERWKETFSLEKKGLKWWNLINLYKHLKGGCKADRTRFFSVVPSNRTRGSVCKRERSSNGKYHREAMESSSLDLTKAIWSWSFGNWL